MAIKVVQGLVGKSNSEPLQAQDLQQQALRTAQQSLSSTAQQSIGKAFQTNEAVITTIRTVKGQASSGSTKPVKDDSEARQIAKEVSEAIRDGGESAYITHSGLDSSRSGAVLLN